MPAAYPPDREPQPSPFAASGGTYGAGDTYVPDDSYTAGGPYAPGDGGQGRWAGGGPAASGGGPRWSVATLIAVIITLLASGLIGWAVYTALASFRIVDVVLGKAEPVSETIGWAFGLGALLALVGVVVAIVALARSRAKLVPTLVLLVALFLPVGALVGGVAQGGPVWVNQTMAQLTAYGSQLTPEQLDSFYDMMSTVGKQIPGSQEILDKLDELRGNLPAGAGPAQSGAPAQPEASATP